MSKWTTKNGKTLEISKMETSHILNCIKMLKRKYDHGYIMRQFGFSDGEIMYYDEAQEDITEQSIEEVFPIYVSLKKELENRGIYEY